MGEFSRAKPKTKGKAKKPLRPTLPARCRFCREKVFFIDYKDTGTLQRMVSSQAKMLSRKRTGNCAFHQRQAQVAIKRARVMALLPYVA